MKILKRIVLSFTLIICLCITPIVSVQAKEGEWKSLGNYTYSIEGTDIVVKVEGLSMRISGTGDLPNYDIWTAECRPWKGHQIESVVIDSTINSVGTHFFDKMKTIKYIAMGTSTFINDYSSFSGVGTFPIFRIVSTGTNTQMVGTIPYTSIDSIARFAQSCYRGESFVLDDIATVRDFQNSTNPSIANVFAADDTDAPWNNLGKYKSGNVATKFVTMPAAKDFLYRIDAKVKYPGMACLEAFAAFIGDYNYACSFNMDIYRLDKKISDSGTVQKYVVDIPKKYVGLGTSYKLLAIGKGVVNSYEDLDLNPNTITFETQYPSTTYAIIYK